MVAALMLEGIDECVGRVGQVAFDSINAYPVQEDVQRWAISSH
jgi:hypothetical protein